MKYAVLIYDKPGSHEALDANEREAVCGETPSGLAEFWRC